MPTGYNITGDIQYENMLLRARNEELEEENDKLCEELAERNIPRYEMAAYTIYAIALGTVAGIALQATYGILPNV